MTDREYTRDYWKYADEQQGKLLRFIRSRRLALFDELQVIFDHFQGIPLQKNLSKPETDRLHRYIAMWQEQGLNVGEGKLLMQDLRNRTRIKGDEALLIFLLAAIISNYLETIEKDKEILTSISQEVYKKSFSQAKNITGTGKSKTPPNVESLLAQPMPNGQQYDNALYTDARYRANQIAQRVRANKQQEKLLDINSSDFQRVMQSQQNWQLRKTATTSDGGYAGYYDMVMTFIVGHTVAQAFMDAGVKRYQFIATIDERTTDECRKLHLKIFDMLDLKLGINAPPVYPPPHPCRSVIRAVQ